MTNILNIPKGLYKPKGSNIWWLDLRLDGKRLRISTKTDDLDIAKKILEDTKRERNTRLAEIRISRAVCQLNAETDTEWADKIEQSWAARMFSKAKTNASSRGLKFDLTLIQFKELLHSCNGRCSVTGISLASFNEASPYKPSLDRIDSSKHYSLDNCRIVCSVVNIAMNKWGEKVLEKIGVAFVLKRMALSIVD
jgi:hypothetical protein